MWECIKIPYRPQEASFHPISRSCRPDLFPFLLLSFQHPSSLPTLPPPSLISSSLISSPTIQNKPHQPPKKKDTNQSPPQNVLNVRPSHPFSTHPNIHSAPYSTTTNAAYSPSETKGLSSFSSSSLPKLPTSDGLRAPAGTLPLPSPFSPHTQ